MDINKLFNEIHEIYESHDGGGIYLSKKDNDKIKNLLRESLVDYTKFLFTEMNYSTETNYTPTEQVDVYMQNFIFKMMNNQKDCPSEFKKIVDDNLFDLI